MTRAALAPPVMLVRAAVSSWWTPAKAGIQLSFSADAPDSPEVHSLVSTPTVC